MNPETAETARPPAPGTAPGPGPGPDLLYSDTETALRASVRALLDDRADPAGLPARAETGDPYDAGVWRALATDIGVAGLLVPEALGGQGASHREAAVVLEELGRAVTPAPVLTSSVIATETLLALDTRRAEVAGLLAAVATGRTVAAVAVPLVADPYTPPPPPADGRITGVADALAADVLLVPRPDGLYAVGAADALIEPLTALDLTRPLATVSRATGGTRLAGPAETGRAVRRGLLAGAGLLASEQLGVAEWCLERTVRHTRERRQFNRPVGSFQALKHRMARLWLDLVSARAAARNAADALAGGAPDTAVAIAVAGAYVSDVAVRAAEACVQLHGGIAMTWEYPAHLYLKRAKSGQIALGSPGRHRAELAALVSLPMP